MATLTEAYICHVGNVLDLLLQDKDLDTESHSFLSPNPLPLEFVDASTPQYIHKVDANLQSLVQKMFKMEQELAWHRKHFKAMHPTTTLVSDIVLAPPILTPPVDSLSPPISASSRWADGNWEFVNHTATHTSVRTDRTLPTKRSLLLPTIDTLVPELVSGTLTPPTLGASLAASHSSNASENVAVCLNGHIPGSFVYLSFHSYYCLPSFFFHCLFCLVDASEFHRLTFSPLSCSFHLFPPSFFSLALSMFCQHVYCPYLLPPLQPQLLPPIPPQHPQS